MNTFISGWKILCISFCVLCSGGGGGNNAAITVTTMTTTTTTTVNHNYTTSNTSAPINNFKRQNTIDSATIKENTARLNPRPVKNTANLTIPAPLPIDSSKSLSVYT